MRNINKIIIHHTATEDDGDINNVAGIRWHHINKRGWQDIGYHFLIEKIGNTYEVLVGRPLDIKGAHAFGHNTGSIGVAFIGNYSDDIITNEMIQIAVVRLLGPLCKVFNLSCRSIIGHKDVNNTECPGNLFPLEYLKGEVKKLI